MKAAERDEVTLAGLLIPLQSRRHAQSLTPMIAPLKPKPGLSGPPGLPLAAGMPQAYQGGGEPI
jgi:hypothetical protein